MASEHARAAILSVGDEIALGQILDTNSQWLSARLVSLGVVPVSHETVPDDAEALTAAIRRGAAETDLVIVTGGLGPTADDLTREALSHATADQLVVDGEALARLEKWFAGRGRPMAEMNKVQALRPSRAVCLDHPNGTAPGLFASSEGKRADIFCLPGPPNEMKPMFESHVLPRLRPPRGRTVITRTIHTVGIGESDLATKLGSLMDRGRMPLVGTTASKGLVSVRIRYEGPMPKEEAEQAIEAAESQVRSAAGPHVFGVDEQSLESVILDSLKERRRTVAVVESCTGGLLGASVTAVPGSSAAFIGGWITYSNEQKEREVGVPAAMLRDHGAVSREVASAMAIGGLEHSRADHCLAITGIAGPDGGTPAKPVGTVYIAHAWRADDGPAKLSAGLDVRRFIITGGREEIRLRSAKCALGLIHFHLQGQPPGRPRMLWERTHP